ncbi:GntR family transcriptional regulator [Vreelandella sp. EE22]
MDPVSHSANLISERKLTSLTTIVAQELERLIITGHLKPGDRVNELRLAEKLNVSRGIVREARRGLERAGLLTSIPNRGVFVKQVSKEEYIENSDVRAFITGFVCQCAAERGSLDQRMKLRKMVTDMSAAIEEARDQDYYHMNLEFHEYILQVANHKRAADVYDDLVKDSHLVRKFTLKNKVAMEQSNAEHDDIVLAIEAGDSIAAYTAGFEHVKKGLVRWLSKASLEEDQENR